MLQAEQQVRLHQATVDEINGKIDYEIAFDVDLRNDAQRKARRIELCGTSEFREAAEQLQAAKDRLTELQMEHQLLHNQFTVLKLAMRESIALRELQAS